MGTDIHLYVEAKRYGEGKWTLMMHEDCAWSDGNYHVFAILADVRNGYGFAGCKTGEGFRPISAQRGLPHDVTQTAGEGLQDEHSISWLTAKEILDYDWKQETKLTGVITGEQFLNWDGKWPESYSGGVMGAGIRTVAAATAKKMSKETLLEKTTYGSDAVYVQVEWSVTYEQCAERFLKWVRGLFEKADYDKGIDGGPFAYEKPENVRFVFGFDS